MIAGSSSFFFFKCIGNKLCSWAALLQFWFQTDLGRENSASYYRQGRQLFLTFITIVTRWSHSTSNLYALIGQNLTSEFMAKMYAASGNLFTDNCSSWQSFVPSYNVFNCLIFNWMYEIKYSYYRRFFCHSWLVCLLGFGLRNAPLVKAIGNPTSDGIVFVFHLALTRKRVEKSHAILAQLTWWLSGASSRLVSLSNYCIWCLFFFWFHEVECSLYG